MLCISAAGCNADSSRANVVAPVIPEDHAPLASANEAVSPIRQAAYAWLVQVGDRHPSTVKLAPGQTPDIEFEERVFDFGRVRAGQRCNHTFKFKNTGSGTLEIRYVLHSGATHSEPPHTKLVEPGESGEIQVSLSTRSRNGCLRKSYHVYTNVPGDDEYIELEVLIEAWQPITWTPSSVQFPRMSMDEYQQALAARKKQPKRLE